MTEKQRTVYEEIKRWLDIDEYISIQDIIFEMQNYIGLTDKQLGGVVTSLQNAGYIKVKALGEVEIIK